MILIANTANAAKTVTLQLPAAISSLKRLDGGKEITAQGGKATFSLGVSEAMGMQY